MISASTAGWVASQATRRIRIWSLGLRLGGNAREKHLYGVATGLGANQAPSSEEVAEVGDEGGVAESDPGLGRQARLAFGRAHRVDARELNLDRDDAARPAALSRPRRAQAAWHLTRAAVEDRDRAVSPPGGEGDAGLVARSCRRIVSS
jgi:hypothetical protein